MNDDDNRFMLKMAILGFVMGVIMGDAITMLFASTSDQLIFVSQSLSDRFGDTMAFIIQSLVSGVVGFIAWYSTKAYYDERFSIIAATLIHMVITMSALIIAGYFLGWIGPNAEGLLMFLVLPLVIYTMIWFSIYMSYRMKIQQINESLKRRRSGKE
ncbi:MAG: DUF3021 domain-containing protein [Candidatus Methanomethylophilaceae archaeon]|nr:DUF3021 domain-containing protein [Candidatus Methanomethylophilaceae archaeon]